MRTMPKFFAAIYLLTLPFLINGNVMFKQEHSMLGPFTEETVGMKYWDFTGNAQVHHTHISLTSDLPGQQGAMWNNFPCLMNDWEIQIQFRIHGKGGFLNGDGMAIWYVRETLQGGPVFGSKDYFSGLGVFIDTFENHQSQHQHRHPYISAMINNGSLHYEHDEDGTYTQLGGCHVPVRNANYPTKIAVSYQERTLTVFIDVEGLGQWRPCFRSLGVHLPTGYTFGISASSREHTDNQDVIAVTTLSMDTPDKQWEDRTHIIPEAENFEIPQHYHKDYIEEQQRKVQEMLKRKMEEEKKTQEKAKEEQDHVKKEKLPTISTTFTKKVIYVVGTVIILVIAVSLFKKYNARRQERLQKRLY